MKTLALDSAQKTQSFCLAENGNFIFSKSFPGKSSELIENIKAEFSKVNLTPQDINLLAVNLGPGSFTGIRNALSIIKTLSIELNLDVLISNSFELIRFDNELDEQEPLCIPAFKGNFFISKFNEKLNKFDEYFSLEDEGFGVYSYCRENTSELIIRFHTAKTKLAKQSLSQESAIITVEDIEQLEPYYLREASVDRKAKR